MEEQVLVVPRSKLFLGETPHGFSRQPLEPLLLVLENESFFMARSDAESDPSHKQLIPYVLITCQGNIFTVQRLKGQGEARLHHKISIGLGGHINPEDELRGEKLFEAGLRRELSEELVLDEPWEARFIGVLNDDTTPVGSVHFGLVYHVDLNSGKVAVRETEKMSGNFLTPQETGKFYDSMETWSQFLFSSLWPKPLPLAPPARLGRRFFANRPEYWGTSSEKILKNTGFPLSRE